MEPDDDRTPAASAAGATASPRTGTREEWRRARLALLEREKAHTREGDALARARRELPWVAVGKEYRFDGPEGRVELAALFDGRSQLAVYHFMFGAGWEEGCPSCSFLADHFDGARVHLAQRDVTLVAVSRAPLARLEAFRRRMGWSFPWYSSAGSDFNFDFRVAASEAELRAGTVDYNFREQPILVEEMHGLSVFAKDARGRVHHTYSTYARGAEPLVGTYAWLDLVPKGRDEGALAFPMAWVRHRDRYGAQPDEGYRLPFVSPPGGATARGGARAR